MNYSTKSGMVRVSLFKGTGKWHADCAVDMGDGYEAPNIEAAVFEACVKAHREESDEWTVSINPASLLRMGGMIVCLDPHYPYAHPVMLTADRLSDAGVTI